MKTVMVAVLAMLVVLLTPSAFAQHGNKNGGTLPGCVPSGNTPPKCGGNTGGNGGNGGSGGQGGSSTSTNTNTNSAVGIGVGGNSSSTSSATGGNAVATGGSATQGQKQSQGQSQSASSTSSAVNGGQANTQVTENKQVRQAPAVFAPEAYPTAPCRVGASAGGSGPMGGLMFGGSKEDKDCSARELARSFHSLGEDEAAIQALCSTKAAERAKLTICQVKR